MLETETCSWKLERLHVIRLALQGKFDFEQIGQARGLSFRTVMRHVKAFREGGLPALLMRKEGKRGPKSPLSEGQREVLRQGLAESGWVHARHLRRDLEEKHSVKVSLSTVYKYLAQLKARPKVTRKVHVKQKPQKTLAFREGELLGKLRALDIPPERPVRLWVQDEARFGLHTTHRRAWSLPGVRIKQPSQQKYQWDYVYGMLEVEGQGLGQYLPSVSLPDTAGFAGVERPAQ